jgi:flagellar protein FliL
MALMSSAMAVVEGEAAREDEKPSGRRKLILIAVSAVLLLILVGGGLWFSGILTHRAGAGAKVRSEAAAEKPALIDVPDIVTNLDSGSRRAIFVKLKAKIEVAHAADQATIAANMPQILDAFQTYLRSMRPEELHGGEGTYRLREALMNRIDVIAAPVQILDVLFVEMLIQ